MYDINIDADALIEFNRKTWPHRANVNIETLIDWRLHANPYYTTMADGLVVRQDNTIVGQIMPIFSQIVTAGKAVDCVWGSDYFVDENYRSSMAGMRLLKSMLKSYVHFGVGMSDISLKLHTVLGEKQVGERHDQIFISVGVSQKKYELLDFTSFLSSFEDRFLPTFKRSRLHYFARSAAFYKWVFAKAPHKDICIACDPETSEFVMFFNTKKKGVPICKIVDYSPGLHHDKDTLKDMIKFYGSRRMKALFFFCGAVSLGHAITLKTQNFPVLSNIKKKHPEFDQDKTLHITGLDSDRLVNAFL